ncbi:MutS domain protein, family 5 [Candidatus Syntrophocurvum alkaliphilum]|uniref:MutS domain protein, family 5 n=1 Tax=Candidatus Syntrophocurvum alkaliphilum TaxID=2293317 RepID=A0A6I6DIU2_9FIRM|nr:DNA mismatch repair protein MutS [Candidatus Syntrophocurvum alkaliphilum]QGU00131.1 MutS domain protein, family 5 [Candidatus Syntrophocurvum alkaliphilum]
MFYSILFTTQEQHRAPRQTETPACFKDLNLDQIFTPILESKKKFELESFFYTALHDPEIIIYRQNVMRELEDDKLCALFTEFSKTVYDLGQYMNKIRSSLNSKDIWHNNYLTRGQMLDCADRYCRAISALSDGLSKLTLYSAGLRNFAEYLSAYCASEGYTELHSHVKRLRDKLSTVEYCMLIKNGTIRVRKYERQADHSKQILAIFDKFRQGNVKDYRHELPEEPHATHVEAAVLDMVAELYKDIFAVLNDFCSKYFHFEDETILRFSREIQFYLSWLDYIRPLRGAGLPFNYPKLCNTAEHLYNLDMYDLALAATAQEKIVTNNFELNAPEHIIVVTGPNQGGKTTFARAFGQVHFLASLGLCVPGREAALYMFDDIFTHFGREEDLSTLNGKLADDLVRLHELLSKSTSRSVIIINEIFASTTLSDALSLGGHMMDAISTLEVPALVVTFLDELASYGSNTVSMMSTVKEENPSQRTYKIIRKPPDGLAYAMYIAGEHGLTYEKLSRRLGR